MIVSWLSFICFLIAALFNLKLAWHDWHTKKELAVHRAALSLGIFLGFHYIFQKQIMMAGLIISFCGLTILVSGLFARSKLQVIPSLVGFLFLALHIIDRLS